MKMSWCGQGSCSGVNKRGSTSVLLAVTFVFMSLAVAGAIVLARRMAVASECCVFGNVWTKAVLSEYDRFLFEDYGILAYQEPDFEVEDKLFLYEEASMSGKLDIKLGPVGVELYGFEMSDPGNFRQALKKNSAFLTIDALLANNQRRKRTTDDLPEDRVIRNEVVLDTLPSRGSAGSFSVDEIIEFLKSGSVHDYFLSRAAGSAAEIGFIQSKFNSHLFTASDLESYYVNEWEYIINGDESDQVNLNGCRRRIFLIRNALNYAYLIKNPEKQALITGVAELITPGPLGAGTKLLITEAWAAAEAELDVRDLLEGRRVPLIKTDETWRTDLRSLLYSHDFRKQLDEESRELLDENTSEIADMDRGRSIREELTEGQTYEDYLMLLLLAMREETRLYRIMDLVQINMKYRYYSDFNLEEYYNGVRFNVTANGKTYEFENRYH